MPHIFDYPLAVIDVETTGTSYTYGGVIDVGVLRIEQGQVVQTFQQLINPGTTIPAFITQLTSITNDQLADAPYFGDIAKQLHELLTDCVFVAHNARFDYAFIKEEFKRANIRYAPKTFCTVKLSRGLFPHHRHHNLDALISRFNIAIQDRHRAFGDAQATWQAMQTMVSQAEPKLLEHIVKQQLRMPTLPPQLPKTTIDSLPDSPGVYIFENAKGAPLYVGKSINIKSRVLSHFSDDVRSAKELTMAQEVAHIRTIPTSGELGALLKESELIKSLMPIYNRLLRRKTELVLAIQNRSPEGYPTVRVARHGQAQIESRVLSFEYRVKAESPDAKLETLNSKLPTDSIAMESVVAVFKSEREAKDSLLSLAKEYKLCHKFLGLQKTSGACFAHQLGHCSGACVGKELPISYELRFNQAFAGLKLQRWPYPGPILVTEHDRDNLNHTSFIIDQWRIVSVIHQRDQDTETSSLDATFDLDQYKILRQYLNKPHANTTVTLLQPQDAMYI